MSSETFGQWLKAQRESLGMSLRDVERATEGAVSNAALSQIESGKIEKPNIVIVAALTAVYGLPSGEVFDRAMAGNSYSPPPTCPTCGQVIR
jgi:transcriptional regulator with XRE-family HTH domain